MGLGAVDLAPNIFFVVVLRRKAENCQGMLIKCILIILLEVLFIDVQVLHLFFKILKKSNIYTNTEFLQDTSNKSLSSYLLYLITSASTFSVPLP